MIYLSSIYCLVPPPNLLNEKDLPVSTSISLFEPFIFKMLNMAKSKCKDWLWTGGYRSISYPSFAMIVEWAKNLTYHLSDPLNQCPQNVSKYFAKYLTEVIHLHGICLVIYNIGKGSPSEMNAFCEYLSSLVHHHIVS